MVSRGGEMMDDDACRWRCWRRCDDGMVMRVVVLMAAELGCGGWLRRLAGGDEGDARVMLKMATAKANTINGERQLQALIDKKKVIIMESSIRSDLHLKDAEGTDCLPTATIFEELTRMGTMASLIICLATNQKFNLSKYIFDAMVKQRKNIVVTQEETQQDDSVPTPSNDPPLSGLQRLRKVSMSRRVESSEDKESLGDHEDASKQGRSIEDIDKDADISLVDDTRGVGEKQEQSVKEREVDTSVEDSAAPTTIEEITLAQTLIQIKAAKPKVVTTAATTITTTRPKARGVVVKEPSKFKTPQESQPSMIKDKGKEIMIEPKVPLKRKDQVALDDDLARNHQAQLEAELIEEERPTRKKEEEANIALIESWDNTQAMM
ncbi:hypothetical protein Tco_0793778 [Tanacetum coccineum]